MQKDTVKQSPFIDEKGLVVWVKPSRRKTIRKTRIEVEGTLTINSANFFVQQIKPVFENYDYVDFYLNNIETVDLSFIQSLYHLKTFFAAKDKNVTIDAQLTDDMKKIITQSGFEKLILKTKNV
ncbi:MAG: hypothetical protein AAFO69_06030 [Bacteroidota bacterium]